MKIRGKAFPLPVSSGYKNFVKENGFFKKSYI